MKKALQSLRKYAVIAATYSFIVCSKVMTDFSETSEHRFRFEDKNPLRLGEQLSVLSQIIIVQK
ncbi:MAG TPA: hypothetical protein VGC97_14670 [Pyrinomonadaceae bacterium]|jgi:hypothetical protein